MPPMCEAGLTRHSGTPWSGLTAVLSDARALSGGAGSVDTSHGPGKGNTHFQGLC